jgi:hypothetical protein
VLSGKATPHPSLQAIASGYCQWLLLLLARPLIAVHSPPKVFCSKCKPGNGLGHIFS